MPTYHQKRVAEQDVRDVIGVGWVSNDLYVHTLRRDNSSVLDDITVDKGPRGEDALLARGIENRLKANWVTAVSSDSITVRVQNGVAVLTGAVDSWKERVEAGQVAAHTEWIWLVDNRLTVDSYTYPWDDWYYRNPYTYDQFSSAYENQELPAPNYE